LGSTIAARSGAGVAGGVSDVGVPSGVVGAVDPVVASLPCPLPEPLPAVLNVSFGIPVLSVMVVS
jgi:hypothetical protein